MLVHKKSLGVLIKVWNESGTRLLPANFKTYPDANPDEWWYINFLKQRTLALNICRYYPDFIPVTDAVGNLIGISTAAKEAEPQRVDDVFLKAEQKRRAREKGYVWYFRMGQREGALDILSSELVKTAQRTAT